jgi:hypothetical protein
MANALSEATVDPPEWPRQGKSKSPPEPVKESLDDEIPF